MLTDPEISKQFALANYKRLQLQLPRKLSIKENNLFKNFNKDASAPLIKLKKLFAFMNELYAFVNKFAPCKMGCASCCHMPVSVSGIEIDYIEQVAGIKRTPGQSIPFGDDLPCPFLLNDSCSIYDARPFVCRRHVMLDKSAKWCQTDVCNEMELHQVRFSELDKTYEYIVHQYGLGKWVDIRQIF